VKISIVYNSLKDTGLLAQQSVESERTGAASKFPASCCGIKERNKNSASFALPHDINCDNFFTMRDKTLQIDAGNNHTGRKA